MNDFILYLCMIAVGYIVGIAFRRTGKPAPWLATVLTSVVMLLVFTMGLRIGANEDVVSNLNFIGLYALVFTIAVLAFTGVLLFFVRRALGLDRYGMVKSKTVGNETSDDEHEGDDPSALPFAMETTSGSEQCEENTSGGIDKMTLRILLAVIAGLVCGLIILHFNVVDFTTLNAAAANVIRLGLCALLIFIGLDLGIEGSVLKNIREAGLRILSVPITVIVATLAASAVCSLFLPVGLKESLAIGAGFGWYSLAPGIIMDQGYITAGAISFLHNILREMISILIIPTVARRVGYIECSGLGGATSMDVGLPIVEQSTNGITAVYAFVSGAVLSLLVPVLVPLILAF